MPDTTSLDIRVALANNVIEVTMGAARASVPVEQLDSFLRALEGCRLIASASASAGATAATPAPARVPSAAPAPAAPQAVPPAPAARAKAATKPAAPAKPAKAAKPAAEAKPAKAGSRKRRSRKRVGDALVGWMQSNPGWHSEEHLLRVVIDNKMSDASPKRALKIALGKQRDDLFEGDGHGHWKLKTDTAAGPPPKPKPKERKKPGRKPKALLQQQAAAAAAAAEAKGGAAAAPAAPAASAAPAAETKGGEQKRKSLRVKKKSTVPPSPAAEVQPAAEATGAKVGAPAEAAEPKAPAGEGAEEATAATEGAKDEAKDANGRRVLVKQGQDRKSASFAPGEKEAREEATQRSAPRKGRWNGVSTDEVERARRNLLGLGGGPGAAKSRTSAESDKA